MLSLLPPTAFVAFGMKLNKCNGCWPPWLVWLLAAATPSKPFPIGFFALLENKCFEWLILRSLSFDVVLSLLNELLIIGWDIIIVAVDDVALPLLSFSLILIPTLWLRVFPLDRIRFAQFVVDVLREEESNYFHSITLIELNFVIIYLGWIIDVDVGVWNFIRDSRRKL